MSRAAILSIGHSNHAIERFVALLREHGVAAVADVRSRPYSRWVPHFNKAALSSALAAAGIRYLFLGRELGGRPEGDEYYDDDGRVDYARRARAPDFAAGIERLLHVARQGSTAILCAEEDPRRCHRRLLVTPALLAHGAEVIHLRGDGRAEPEEALQLALFE
jgi:uncharacterized protein (DUF488 family)